MKQILQNLKTGKMEVADLPCPQAGQGSVLIRTRASLISAGTERMLVEFSKANLIQKARQQPEKVRQVLDKIRTDGLVPTLEAVFRKLDEPLPLGYCNVGRVTEVGGQRSERQKSDVRCRKSEVRVDNHEPRTTNYLEDRGQGIEGLKVGDRVVSNGPHAEVVCVPRNLCAKIPDGVTDEQAAFTVLGSIALQGMRLAAPTFGEKFMVFGMGLIGLLAVRLLQANGCEVLAVDLNAERLKLAEAFGAQTVNISAGGDPVAGAMAGTGGKGVDGVLITASARTDEIMHQAAEACRKRGRIVLVGVVGLNLRRSDFYEKEITFQVSCSYGPGRYDEKYEQDGQDYPIGYVRWTEQRNFEAVLGALEAGRLRVDEMITHRYPFEEAEKAYEKIQKDSSALGVILEYGGGKEGPQITQITQKGEDDLTADERRLTQISENTIRVHQRISAAESKVTIGLIGAGNFTGAVLLPALKKTGVRFQAIASSGGGTGTHLGKKFGFEESTTDTERIFEDKEINTVFVTTRHNSHARFVMEALEAGKHVFVEKPLCMNEEELEGIKTAYQPSGIRPQTSDFRSPTSDCRHLMVGYNRRFSPHTIKIKELLAGRAEPLCMNMTVNAGIIPQDHWIHDPEVGGGRIVGEGCHFIDLMVSLTGSMVQSVSACMAGDGFAVRTDKMSIVLGFADGSVGTVNYFANGSKSYPKEMLEVFSEGRVLRMENFRITLGYGFKGFKRFRTLRQDKGHNAEVAAFVERIAAGGEALIPFEQLENVTRAGFAAVESARERQTVIL